MKSNCAISLEMLPDNFQYVAEMVGSDNAITLVEKFGGTTLYIPKHDTYTRSSRNKLIVDDYKAGLPYSQIAIKHNLTTAGIRAVIASCLWLVYELTQQQALTV